MFYREKPLCLLVSSTCLQCLFSPSCSKVIKSEQQTQQCRGSLRQPGASPARAGLAAQGGLRLGKGGSGTQRGAGALAGPGQRAAVGTISVTEAGRAGSSARASAAWRFGRLGNTAWPLCLCGAYATLSLLLLSLQRPYRT